MKAHEAYGILGLRPGAGVPSIKASYHRMLKRHHPDLAGGTADRNRLEEVVDAYRCLLDLKNSIVSGPSARRRPAPVQPADISPSEVAALGHLVVNGRTASMRAFSARRLGHSGKRSAYAFLRSALYDSDPLVVRSAVRAIGQLKVAQCAGEIASLFHRADCEIRHLIFDMVEMAVETVRFQDVILVGMRDIDPSIRKRALSLYARSITATREEVG